MKVLLVANPASGRGRGANRLQIAEAALKRLGARVESVLTQRVGHARALLASPPAGIDRVVACGGDGLVSEVAAALSGGDLPLAIVPAGRGNDLARGLSIPLDIGAAAELALRGRITRMAMGRVGGATFCTVAACGLDAEVSRRGRSSRLPLPGPAIYVAELLLALRTLQPVHARIEHDGGVFEGDVIVVAVANSPTYGGGFRIAPRARLDDGLLDACIVRATGRLQALALFPRIRNGAHESLPQVVTFRSSKLRVVTDPPLSIEADGEPLAATPATYTCEAAALPVVVPEGGA